MRHAPQNLGETLVANRLITQQQLDEALELQRQSPAPLGQILTRSGMVTEDLLLQVLGAMFGVAAWHLQKDPPNRNAARILTPDVCRTYRILPIQKRGDLLILGMANPAEIETIDLVRNLTKLRVEPVLCSEPVLESFIDRLANQDADPERMDTLVVQAMSESGGEEARGAISRSVLTEEDTRPVVGLVNQIVTDAIRMRASDVHIEPRYEKVEIRFRLDGQLAKMREFPKRLLPMVVARLKIMAELDIVEYRMPQDGRIAVQLDGRTVDIRVSVLPNVHGQRIVLRILDKSIGLRRLEELGFEPSRLTLFRRLIEKPYGMIFVTGPTGSGKTTTLYAALRETHDPTRNTMTCEDPVEYEIDGVNQSQVNEKVGLTFSAQLRAILRQDPDVVLVGEVRDEETVQTALRAAMSGHLVLSTLHCNDALSAIPRLQDLGADPFLLSTALIGVTAQRLVRTLCPDCKTASAPTADEAAQIAPFVDPKDRPLVWRPGKCHKCHQTGYRGRTTVQEILPISPAIADLIAARGSTAELRRAGERLGYESMAHDAIRRVLAGQTTLDEVRRHVFLPTWEEGAQRAA